MGECVGRAARGLFLGVLASVGALFFSPVSAFATGSVSLAWDANTEPNISGYTVFYRSADNVSHGTQTVGDASQISVTVANLRSGVQYFFSVSAFDNMGVASTPSNEVSTTVPGTPDPGPGTGTPDPVDGGVNTYFAEGASGDTFNYRLAVLNTTAQNTQFTVQYVREGAAPVVRVYALPAFLRMTLTVTDIPELKNTSFGAVINAIPGVIAERTMSWNGGDATTAKALTAPSTTWYLAEGNVGYFDTFILLVNPSTTQTATVGLDFLTGWGSVVHIDRQINPTQRLTVYTNADVPQLQNQSFATTVHSDVPILVERAMYFRNGGSMFVGGDVSGAVPAAAPHWFMAEGQSGGFFATYVLVSNPNASPVDLDVRYLTAGGVAREDHLTLAATQRLTLQLSDYPELKNTDVSTDISASAPIIAERTMYWPATGGAWYASHNSVGQTELATRWGLAEGEVGGPNKAMTYVLLANPNAASTDVTLTYYPESGAPPVTVTRTVPGNSRLTVDSVDAGLNSGERFGVVVSSAQPIAVERSCYWSVGGQLWSSGTNEVGTKLP